MIFGSKTISLLLGSTITGFCLILALFLGFDKNDLLLLCFIFVFTTLCIYFTLEYLVFREINKIYSVFDKIRQKDDNFNLRNFNTKNLPIKRKQIYQEVYSYVTKKQAEIKELKNLEVFRREFLADISHELRTPIFAAQGFIHTLLDGAMNEREVREKFLRKAAKSLDGLQQMVDELLTLSKLETGELKMNMQDFDIKELTVDVFEILEISARKHNTELRFAENSDKPTWVNGDAYQINQVVKNLVENSIKYGNDHGKVVVGFDIDKDNVIISVKDDGPGIAPEHLKRVFDRFYRIEKSRSKEKGGFGLGLAIVQEIVEAHDSKVLVTSKIGKGTTFAFILKKAQKNDKVPKPDRI